MVTAFGGNYIWKYISYYELPEEKEFFPRLASCYTHFCSVIQCRYSQARAEQPTSEIPWKILIKKKCKVR